MARPITTFMIAQDPYLVRFVDQFTRANAGKAFYSSLDGLGEWEARNEDIMKMLAGVRKLKKHYG